MTVYYYLVIKLNYDCSKDKNRLIILQKRLILLLIAITSGYNNQIHSGGPARRSTCTLA